MLARHHLRDSLRLLLAGTLALAACKPGPPSEGVGEPSTGPAASAGGGAMTDSASADVSIRTSEQHYAPGAQVKIQVVNHSDGKYAFNPCPRTLERSTGGSWEKVEEPGRMCTMEAWILDPHQTRDATTELPSSLAAGTYRMVIYLTREGSGPPAERATAYSNSFEVGSAG